MRRFGCSRWSDFRNVRAKLKNLTRIDIEMQADLKRGDNYNLLVPVTSIIWLGEDLLESKEFHSVFHLSEDTTRERFSSDIEIHTLELEKLHLLSAAAHPRLYRWSRFLLARTEEEFELLYQGGPRHEHRQEDPGRPIC